ncbi:MAG: TonB-dependent receptor, partial [Cyclobacteriaceae bacterium]|nr:TonB-dependent receptor [Cyclobacteriaceae bacterium]
MKFFFLALGLFAFAQSYGQNDQDTVYQLENVVINSNALESSYREYTGGVSYISNHQLAVSDPTILTPLINHSPGIYMSQGALNTNKIIIRGIGSRAQYGTSKLRAYYGDIPLTDGSGETVVEDIDLNAIGSVEILKGPNSSLYGTGLGGTLTLNPSKPEIGRFRAYNDLTLGSYRLLRESAGMESADEQHDFRLNYTHMSSEGYRDNSQFDRSSLTATTHLYNGKNKLGFLAYFVDQKAFIPSSISEDDFLTNPQTAAFTWQATEGYESYSRLMAGVSLDHDYGNGLSQITSFFSTFRQGYEPRPFDILRENTAGLGGRTRLIQSLADGKHT